MPNGAALDKILVGETRDLETAEIAIQASLTGHVVFTTLHTNDAPSSITRLQPPSGSARRLAEERRKRWRRSRRLGARPM